jgi:hypothetical protein
MEECCTGCWIHDRLAIWHRVGLRVNAAKRLLAIVRSLICHPSRVFGRRRLICVSPARVALVGMRFAAPIGRNHVHSASWTVFAISIVANAAFLLQYPPHNNVRQCQEKTCKPEYASYNASCTAIDLIIRLG